MEIWRGGCETVAQMADQGWDVISVCAGCGLKMHTDLVVIVKVSGPATSLWNRRQRCRKVGCSGGVKFMARPPGCFTYHDLDAPWPASRGEPGKTGFAGPR